MLETLDKKGRREVQKAATKLYKSGARPSDAAAPERPTRAQIRQAQRALGNRGSKTAQKNPDRHTRRLRTGATQLRQVLAVDEALEMAQARVEHPIKSRLKKKR